MGRDIEAIDQLIAAAEQTGNTRELEQLRRRRRDLVDPAATLGQTVAQLVARGAKVEYRDEQHAVVSAGRPVNHVLHLFLTVITLGLWLLVWIPLHLRSRPRRYVLTVGVDGQVRPDRPIVL
jgi:hypothetical protein